MHHRDLAGRTAEAQQRDPQPDPERLAEAHAVTGIGFGSPVSIRSDVDHQASACWSASCGFRRWRRGTSDRTHRRAPCRPRAAGDRPDTCANSPSDAASRPAASGGGRAARYRRRARSWRAAAAAASQAELLDHHVEGAELAAVAPEHALDVEGRGVETLGDRRDLRRRDEQEHRIRIDEAADQPRAGDAVDLRPRARHPDGAALRVARGSFDAAPAAAWPFSSPRNRLRGFRRSRRAVSARPRCPG